jgi:ATP-dependent DNA helicase RecQ
LNYLLCFRGEDFRKQFGQLDSLKAFFPSTVQLAMTATASKQMIFELKAKLGMADVTMVTRSPNRQNIFLHKLLRGPTNSGLKAFEDILEPLAKSLLVQNKQFPMTIIYLKLKYCGVAFRIFERILRDKQYVNGIEEPMHRLFAEYHAPQTERMKKDIMSEIMKEDSNIRVVFATSALGMGVDVPYIQQIIHITPPATLEAYMQEIGRGARASEQATAILYYNKSDVSENHNPPIHKKMREYCLLNSGCLRQTIMDYFGFVHAVQQNCCSLCSPLAPDDPVEEELLVVRNGLMSVPVFIEEMRDIIDAWNSRLTSIQSLYEIPALPNDLPSRIAEEIQLITDEDYLLDNFDIWEESLSKLLYECIEKHAPLM